LPNSPASRTSVMSSAGARRVVPANATIMLTEATSSLAQGAAPTSPVAAGLARGENVQVWCNSMNSWVHAEVSEVFTESCYRDGFLVVAGTVLVKFDTGLKWIKSADVGTMLRRAESVVCSTSVTYWDPNRREHVPFGFVKGEKIWVFSESRQQWLDGVVEEVYPYSVRSEGFVVPAGFIKVSSDAGHKWVAPALTGRVLQKVNMSGGYDPSNWKAKLAEVLQSEANLHKHVDAIWAVAGCRDAGLPIRNVLWALEGLAERCNVVIKLEDRHLAVVQQRLAALGHTNHDGRLNLNEFWRLSIDMVSDVLRSL